MNKEFDKSLLVETDWLEKNYIIKTCEFLIVQYTLIHHPTKIYTVESGIEDYNEEHIPNSDFLDINDIFRKKYTISFYDARSKILLIK